MKNDFSNLDNVDKYIKSKEWYTELKELGYMGVNGYARLLGWEIILFYQDKVNLSAITLTFSSEYEIIVTESYLILEKMGFDKNKFNIDSVKHSFNFISEEESIKGGRDYYFTLNDSMLILNTSDGKINDLTYIINLEIINGMLEDITIE